MTTTARAGRLLLVDEGSYSDYQVVGFFVVLRDFDPAERLRAHLEENAGRQQRGHWFQEHRFLASLIAQGLLLEIDYGNLYLGDYGNAAAVRFTAGPQQDETP